MKKLISILILIITPLMLSTTLTNSQTPEQREIKQKQETKHPTALTNIWKKRSDLQRLFPDKINGIDEMEDWTLTQWAEQHGHKEYRQLRQYNEEKEKDYIYQKYLPIERALNKIAEREYTMYEYDCKHFTMDLKAELEKSNISSISITGLRRDKENGHRWIAIEFEPTSGRIVETNKHNTKYPHQQLTKNYLKK
jgi:hypothetical protein